MWSLSRKVWFGYAISVYDNNLRLIDRIEFLFNLNSKKQLTVNIVITDKINKYPHHKKSIEEYINQYFVDKFDYLLNRDWNEYFDNKFDTPLLFAYDGKDFSLKKICDNVGDKYEN